MGNLLTNAGFLDGSTGWTLSAQLAAGVDETTRGSAGRAVLTGTGTTTAPNQTQMIRTATAARAVVSAGAEYEVSAAVVALLNGTAAAPEVEVAWFDGSAALVSITPLEVRPAQITAHGEARLGVRNSFRRVWRKVTAPASAVRAELRLVLTPAFSGATVVLGLLKPMIAAAIPARREPLVWDPGLHDVGDLDLPCWPTTLRSFDLGPGGQAQADKVEFGGGPGRPARRRITADPAREFKGSLRCDPVERAMLEAFWREVGDFWFVEPDSDRLCVASFGAEGGPHMNEDRGEVSIIEVGLWLETA